MIVRHWKVTDACGNFTTQDQTIKVADTTAPSFTAFPGHVTLKCLADTTPTATGTPGGADSCSTTTVTSSDAVTTPDCTLPGHVNKVIVRTWKVTDACGNFI